MKKKIFSLILALCMVFLLCSVTASADEGTTLPEADKNGVITLTADLELTEDITISAGETLEVGDKTINANGHKITLSKGSKVTAASNNDIYDVLQGEVREIPDEYYAVAYTANEQGYTYICSDVLLNTYNVYMAGHETIIEKLKDSEEPTDLLLTYTDNNTNYMIRYTYNCGAVVYGGVKNEAKNIDVTSLTMKSGKVAALVGGSKVNPSSFSNLGSVTKAIITVEGGTICGDSSCSSQPYKEMGMVMPMWYQGPDIDTFEFTMKGGTITGDVYGGPVTSTSPAAIACTVNNFIANIEDGEITGNLLCGGHSQNKNVQTVNNAAVTVKGGTISTIYCGGFANWGGVLGVTEYSTSMVKNATVTVNDGTVGRIFGGGQNGTSTQSNNKAVSEVENATINVNGGDVTTVCGGGMNYHWINRYWVKEDEENNTFEVVKADYNSDIIEGNMDHYSQVGTATLNINAPVNTVLLGGGSWAHVENSTANINADVKDLSCIGNFGYVEHAAVNIKEGTTVGNLDMVRSGIVGDVTIDNAGTITNLNAGAPEGSYKSNMGVNMVAVLGDVSITGKGTITNALLTYGLEYATSVNSDFPLTVTPIAYSDDDTKNGTSGKFAVERDNAVWNATIILTNTEDATGDAQNFTPSTKGNNNIVYASGLNNYVVTNKDGVRKLEEVTSESIKKNVAKIGSVYYTSLSDAYTAARDGDAIELIADCKEDLTVEKAITIKGGEYLTGKITAGTGYTITSSGNTYTIKKTTSSGPDDSEDHDCPSAKFTDVDTTQYYHEAVDWAVTNGVVAGTTATTFSPNASCTRAQAVSFLWRAAGSPAPTSTVNPFTDVKSGAYYYDAVLWAVEKNIVAGTTPTTFSPNATVTRAQVAAFLYRHAGSPAVSGSNAFTDVPANAYYADAVQWAVDNKVAYGTSTTTFSPNSNCTRAQTVAFLYRDLAE